MLKFGWSEKNLIPQGAVVRLAGQFYERVSGEVETPLMVTVLVMESNEDTAIFCACDLVGVSHALLDTVRNKLSDRNDIPGDKIILSAIHSHTAPDYARRGETRAVVGFKDVLQDLFPHLHYEDAVSSDDVNFCGEEAHEYMAQQIADAVIEAWDARAEGGYAQGFGRAAVGLCRAQKGRAGTGSGRRTGLSGDSHRPAPS